MIVVLFHYKKVFILSLLICFVAFSFGCSTSLKHYKPIEESLENNEFKKAPDLIKKAREEGNYSKKDRVLYYLDLGLANHYAGNFKQSNQNLETAERYIQELYTKSITKGGISLLTNNNQLPYYGEEYENIYINVFKAMNYEMLNKTSAAFVEIRDMYEKLEYMEQKYQQKAEMYKNNLNEDKYRSVKNIANKNNESLAIKSNFSNSALGRYFNYAMYSSNNEWDEANIDLRKLKLAFNTQPDIYNFNLPTNLIEKSSDDTRKNLVHAIALLGKGPVKKQIDIRLLLPNMGYMKFVIPEIKSRSTNISKVKLFKNEEPLVDLEKIEDVNRVASAVFQTKRPLIIFKNIARSILKGIGANVASDSTDKNARAFVRLASIIYTEFSEQADLRTSRLLPGEFHIASFYLPRGKNELTVKYYSHNEVVSSEIIRFHVSPGGFNLLELINLN